MFALSSKGLGIIQFNNRRRMRPLTHAQDVYIEILPYPKLVFA